MAIPSSVCSLIRRSTFRPWAETSNAGSARWGAMQCNETHSIARTLTPPRTVFLFAYYFFSLRFNPAFAVSTFPTEDQQDMLCNNITMFTYLRTLESLLVWSALLRIITCRILMLQAWCAHLQTKSFRVWSVISSVMPSALTLWFHMRHIHLGTHHACTIRQSQAKYVRFVDTLVLLMLADRMSASAYSACSASRQWWAAALKKCLSKYWSKWRIWVLLYIGVNTGAVSECISLLN